MTMGEPARGGDTSKSLLEDAWHAGVVSRLAVVAGLIVSTVWSILVIVGTARFVTRTVHDLELAWGFKAAVVVFVPLFVVILLGSVPVAWLMLILGWFARRRRAGSGTMR
jgi:hypothetical protein